MAVTDTVPVLATLASLLLLAGYCFRNQLWLRAFAILASLVFIVFFAVMAPQPLWLPLVGMAAVIAVNAFMIYSITADRRMFRLSAEEMMLFARLPGLTPGQYKALLDISEWHNPTVPMQLTQTGVMPKALYYVLEGKVEVNRNNNRFAIGPHAFIGELAFLREKPATATTFGSAGSLIVSWEQDALRNLMKSDEGVRKVLGNLLSADMAEKIAKSAAPLLQEQDT